MEAKIYPSRNCTTVISGSSVSGESEGKILADILSKQIDANNNLTSCIYSPDSDVLIQSVLHSSSVTHVINSFGAENLDTFTPSKFVSDLNEKFGFQSPNLQADFCFLMLLCGNDYLPPIRNTSLSTIWMAYEKFRPTLSQNDFLYDLKLNSFNLRLIKEFAKFHIKTNPQISVLRSGKSDGKTFLEGMHWIINSYLMKTDCNYPNHLWNGVKGISIADLASMEYESDFFDCTIREPSSLEILPSTFGILVNIHLTEAIGSDGHKCFLAVFA